MEGNGDKIKLHERLRALEVRMDTVLDNHLPHIQRKIDDVKDEQEKIRTSQKWQTRLLISNLFAIVGGLVLIIIKIVK